VARENKSLITLLAGGAVGAAMLVALAFSARSVPLAAALAGGGWPLLLASVYRVLPLSLNTLSWHALLPGGARPPFGRMLRLRWIGESINALLPVAQIGGDFARARLLAHGGVSAADATAAMVADLSVGAATPVVFTLMGVAVLAMIAPTSMFGIDRGVSIAIAVGISLVTAGALVAVARLGVGRLLAALPFHGHGRLAARLAAGAANLDRAFAAVLVRRGALAGAAIWHLGGWVAQVGETWLILRLIGADVSWGEALVIESLSATARGIAFAVPAGLGIQEGALVVLCGFFGIDLASALALGIIKRGRELVVGVPAIVAWAIAERHAIANFWRKRTMKERRRRHRSVPFGDGGAAGERNLRVGVLVDLHWTPTAGGHVKTWERLAAAALASGRALDLTVHFLGTKPATHALGPHVRYDIHTPLFSSANLPFLSHIPDHTDLAPHNPLLTSRLLGYDVIHTTDGAFAAARTAARVARWNRIPLTSSIHTTTPYYTRVFTAATIERLAGKGRLGRLLLDRFGLAGSAEARMQRLVDEHHRRCAFVLASRSDDHARLSAMLGEERVGLLRRGIERHLFDPSRRDRPWLEAEFGIARGRQVVISVGRLDRIKNVLVLAHAIRALADRGAPVHLLCPGKGPDKDALVALLGDRVSCPGVLSPDTLARAYASADLCAQPAVIEELSNAVLEASSSGLPLLVGEDSGSARFVIDGQTGMVVRGGGADDWAAAIDALVSDPGRLEAMRRAAHDWSLAHVPSWEQVLAEDLLPIWRRAGVSAGTNPAIGIGEQLRAGAGR
jgi:putative membrane protein